MHKPMPSYDQHLLEEAPKATRAQLQEGYNVDLLEQPSPRRTPSVRNPPSQTPQPPLVNVPLISEVADTGSGEKLGPAAYAPAASKSQTSFWRTRNGVITIVIVALILIGAVVGGAVGGTARKGSHNNVGTTGTGSASSSGFSLITPLSATTATTATNQGFGGVSTKGPSPVPTQPGQNSGGQVTGH